MYLTMYKNKVKILSRILYFRILFYSFSRTRHRDYCIWKIQRSVKVGVLLPRTNQTRLMLTICYFQGFLSSLSITYYFYDVTSLLEVLTFVLTLWKCLCVCTLVSVCVCVTSLMVACSSSSLSGALSWASLLFSMSYCRWVVCSWTDTIIAAFASPVISFMAKSPKYVEPSKKQVMVFTLSKHVINFFFWHAQVGKYWPIMSCRITLWMSWGFEGQQ